MSLGTPADAAQPFGILIYITHAAHDIRSPQIPCQKVGLIWKFSKGFPLLSPQLKEEKAVIVMHITSSLLTCYTFMLEDN